MIGIIFQFGTEIVEVRVERNTCLFRTSQFGGAFATIENLKLNRVGVIKEFPDLKENENWREEGIKRFKEKLSNMKTENERANYVIDDLKKFGYVPLYKQRQGFRPEKIKA